MVSHSSESLSSSTCTLECNWLWGHLASATMDAAAAAAAAVASAIFFARAAATSFVRHLGLRRCCSHRPPGGVPVAANPAGQRSRQQPQQQHFHESYSWQRMQQQTQAQTTLSTDDVFRTQGKSAQTTRQKTQRLPGCCCCSFLRCSGKSCDSSGSVSSSQWLEQILHDGHRRRSGASHGGASALRSIWDCDWRRGSKSGRKFLRPRCWQGDRWPNRRVLNSVLYQY